MSVCSEITIDPSDGCIYPTSLKNATVNRDEQLGSFSS